MGLKKSYSNPVFPVGNAGKQIPSGFQGSPAFSFGAEVYCKTRASPRSAYLGNSSTPGIGSYEMDRALPEQRRMPAYTIGTQKRDKSKLTYISYKHFMVPGPGQYEEGPVANRLLKRTAPCYSTGHRRPEAKGYWSRPTPASCDYDKMNMQNILQRQFPRWKIGTEKKGKSLLAKSSTTRTVGPGTYRHATCLVPTKGPAF
mmetsp:Transcript_16395/g.40497  ORF Transcript_16395/g.40497 Transcript_16395/m.40497 type:complete len:201 (-) Transcript_16395:540-1142(-)